MTHVRTVLGDVTPDTLGVTSAHDHLFFGSPTLPGQELDDVRLAHAEAEAFMAAGGQAIVQWTPRGLGRRRADLATLASATGLAIVSATGRHRAARYGESESTCSPDTLAQRFIEDVDASTSPCGLIKIATGFHHLDTFERTSLEAAAIAHAATGAPIAIHLELGTAGELVVSGLTRLGVPETSIVLGHLGRNPRRRVPPRPRRLRHFPLLRRTVAGQPPDRLANTDPEGCACGARARRAGAGRCRHHHCGREIGDIRTRHAEPARPLRAVRPQTRRRRRMAGDHGRESGPRLHAPVTLKRTGSHAADVDPRAKP